MIQTITLSVVIPAWNRPDELKTLLEQVAEFGIFDEIIVCDDGSQPPCDPGEMGFSSENLGGRLIYLRSAQQRGAGNARNRGFKAVTSDYVLFFDSDDWLEPGIVEAWGEVRSHVAARPADDVQFDFAIFRHIDTRVYEKEGRKGAFVLDERIWDRVLGGADKCTLTTLDRAHLSGISAYPWNKIYRTGFLRDNNINCTESPVHNDLELHWLSFICAQHVMALRLIGASHVVGTSEHHLTNRKGEDRFCVFGIFDTVLGRLRMSSDAPLLAAHFLNFSQDLCRWIGDRIEPDLRDRFSFLARAFFINHVTEEEFAIFAMWQPDKAERFVHFLTGRQEI